jgi:hypothetical protein
VRVVRIGVRGALPELTLARRTVAFAVAALLTLIAATPSPHPSPVRVDLTKIQPKALLPTVPLHTEYIVETNKMGQVTRVVHGKLSSNKTYNMQTYGNALQAFIRTPDDKGVAGKFKLTYDYNPKTARIHRDVSLVQLGGVNPNAEGAANRMMDLAEKQTPEPAPKARPSVNSERLPDLPQIMHSSPP